MKAVWNQQIIAEADAEQLIKIEGNWYFPPQSLSREYFSDSEQHTECFWKGTASYYDVTVDGTTNEAAAWYYPNPKEGSIEKVKNDYTNYVAFWRGIEIEE